MHTAIQKIEKKTFNPELFANQESCEVKLYFSKASERLADHFSSMVFYQPPSKFIAMPEEVALFPHFFILFFEPLLQAVEYTEKIEGLGLLCSKLVLYADGITCLIKIIRFIDMLFRLTEIFCK